MPVSIYIDMKETAVNQSAKTSTVQCDVFAVSTGGSYNTLSPSGSVVFSGNATGTYNFTHNFSANTTTKIYTRTFTVTHSSDGTGTVTAKATFNTGVSSGTITTTKTIALTKINMASTFSVSGPMTFASNLVFTINRQNASFTHLVQVSMGGSKVFEKGSVATTCTWSIPDNLSPSDASSREATATVTTYSGGTIVGSTTQKFNIYVSDQNQPGINSVTVIDNMGYYDDYGVYLSNKSDFSISIKATAHSNATITKYWVRVGDGETTENHLNVVDIGSISLAGSVTLTIGVEDSRGRTKTTTRSITLARPTAPRLTVYAFRTTSSSSNVENDEGNYIRIHVTGSTTRPGTKGTNNGTVTVKYKLQTSSSYTTLSSANRGSSWDFYTYFSGSASNAYDIEVKVTDQIGQSSTRTYKVGTAEPILDFKNGGEGLGIFSVSDVDGIKMGKNIYLPYGSLNVYAQTAGSSAAYQRALYFNTVGATFSGGVTNNGYFTTPDGVLVNQNGGMVQIMGSEGYGGITIGIDSAGRPTIEWGGPLAASTTIGGMMGQILYTNNSGWNSGSEEIVDSRHYRVFIIQNTSNGQEAMIGIRTSSNYICTFGCLSQSDNYMYINAGHYSTDGDTWTRIYPRVYQLSSIRGTGTQATAILAVYRVIGVI